MHGIVGAARRSRLGVDGFSIGELTSNEVVSILRKKFPQHVDHICDSMDYPAGESGWGSKRNGRWSWLAETELGLEIHDPVDTITDTISSMLDLQLINKKMSINELRDFYNVSEMDDCQEEMEYCLVSIRTNEII